ncbi:MAG: DeoR/GlpR family DNA-binding transcription regulator [Clostridia bacterium]|nr:DeoR/GlpR family DNA-binding transcription regulator [Clostridia bacterium]
MLSLERQEEILAILNKNKSATVEELAQELFVSGATIRRDLAVMEKQGLIKRSHGGAIPFRSTSEESAFALREQENITAKRTIANLAYKLVKNGDSVFIDSSSTTGYVIPLLNSLKFLSVTTTGIRNALLLSQTNTIKIYLAGGVIKNHSNSILGTDTVDYISRFHADISLLSCSGVDINAGFSDADVEQSKLKQQMKKNSSKVAMLCDSTKFGKIFMCTDFNFEDIDYLITDKMPPKEFLEKLSTTKCKLITPDNTAY